MGLAVTYVAVIATAMLLTVAAIYAGGGIEAVRRQLNLLLAMTAVLFAIALTWLLMRG
jgi:hypothetical protein